MKNTFARNIQSDQYFTNPNAVRDCLAFLNCKPDRALDLGAGLGSLSLEMWSKWPNAEHVSIDLDPRVEGILASHAEGRRRLQRHHHCANFLSDTISHNYFGSFDLVVSNPPYGSRASLKGAGDADLAAQFFKASLPVLKSDGLLAFFLPDSLITGSIGAEFRAFLLEKTRVELIAELPNGSFMGTDAKAFFIVCRPGKKSGVVRLWSGIEHRRKSLSKHASELLSRMDYSYHSVLNTDSQSVTLNELGAEVVRGRFSASVYRKEKIPCFHTTNFIERSGPFLRLAELNTDCHLDSQLVQQSDILIARVDRSFHNKVAMVLEGTIPITDTIFRVRLPSGSTRPILDFLTSSEGKHTLRGMGRGVGARFLTKANLLNMPMNSKFFGQSI